MAFSGLIVLISSADRQKVDFIANWLSGNIWGADWPFIRAILPWAAILIPFTLYKANRLNLLGLSEPVPIGIGVSVDKKGDSVADSGCACSSSCLCHRRHRLRRAQGSALCKSSGRTSKSALPAGSDSDPRLAAYHRKKHTGTQRHTCGDYDRFNRGSLFYVFVDEE